MGGTEVVKTAVLPVSQTSLVTRSVSVRGTQLGSCVSDVIPVAQQMFRYATVSDSSVKIHTNALLSSYCSIKGVPHRRAVCGKHV